MAAKVPALHGKHDRAFFWPGSHPVACPGSAVLQINQPKAHVGTTVQVRTQPRGDRGVHKMQHTRPHRPPSPCLKLP